MLPVNAMAFYKQVLIYNAAARVRSCCPLKQLRGLHDQALATTEVVGLMTRRQSAIGDTENRIPTKCCVSAQLKLISQCNE